MKIRRSIFNLAIVLFMAFFLLITGCKKENEEPYLVVTDIDGNIYQTVKIGNQVWMAENLRTARYRNGDSIYHMGDRGRWSQTEMGAWCNYDNDHENDKTYGKLYNWYAVNDTRNIAPEGWHVPSAEELWELDLYVSSHLGTSVSLAKALAGTKLWYPSMKEDAIGYDLKTNNSSGFNALPGGNRLTSGIFGYDSIEKDGYWWSTSDVIWNLNYDNTDTNILYEAQKRFGYSVRCIKD